LRAITIDLTGDSPN